MTEDQRRTIVVHAVDINSQVVGQVDIIGGKGIMRLNDADIIRADVGFFKSHLNCRKYGGRHIGRFHTRIAVRYYLNLYVWIGTELLGFILGGYGDAAIAVRRVGLGAEGVNAIGQHRS